MHAWLAIRHATLIYFCTEIAPVRTASLAFSGDAYFQRIGLLTTMHARLPIGRATLIHFCTEVSTAMAAAATAADRAGEWSLTTAAGTLRLTGLPARDRTPD